MTYGCYNRPPLNDTVFVQDGWEEAPLLGRWGWKTRAPRICAIPDPMTKECQYSLTAADPGCQGCKHNRAEQLDKEPS